jgi:translation initiation factor IF-1
MAKQDLIKLDGIIEEALSNAMFRVRLESGHLITATISER